MTSRAATLVAFAVAACGGGSKMAGPPATELRFAAVSAGSSYSCGVTTAGAAYCWGYNPYGQLGDSTTTNRSNPKLVAGGLSFAAVNAAAVGYHTCGVTTAGVAYCWGGTNFSGELGDGTAIQRTSPVAVAGGLSFAAVSAGLLHSCGVTTATAAYCWGNNSSGRLGDGTMTARSSPGLVAGGLSFAAVSAGNGHSCGVTTAGAAYCWGLNSYGQLGNGTSSSSLILPPGLVAGGLRFATVSAGDLHSCGVTAAGAAYCWGANGKGQLGDGTVSNIRLTPVPVLGGLSFAGVSAGAFNSCGVTTAGAAYCWGDNSFAQLGDGTATQRTTPVAVLGGINFAAVSAGSLHSCGVTTASAVYCWGDNRNGGLGDGTTTNRLSPVTVVP